MRSDTQLIINVQLIKQLGIGGKYFELDDNVTRFDFTHSDIMHHI